MRVLSSQLVVVVDNSATNLKILARLAASLGETVAVQAFADPAAALSACAERRPDLIVAAGEMAQCDAARFVARLRDEADCAGVPVVVVAPYEERGSIDRALGAGAADHLLSPIDHREFRTRAKNLLALARYEAAMWDEVVVMGRQGSEEISVHEVASWKNSVSYDVLTGWRERLPRIYLNGKPA